MPDREVVAGGEGAPPRRGRPASWRAPLVWGGLSALLFSGPLMPFAVAPVVIAHRRYGLGQGIAAVGAAAAAVAALTGQGATGLVYLLGVGSLGLLLGDMLGRTRSAAAAVGAAAGVYCASLGVAGGLAAWVTGDSIPERIGAASLEILRVAPTAGADLGLDEEGVREVAGWIARLFPGILAAGVVLTSWMAVLVTRWLAGREAVPGDLARFRLPMGVMWTAMAVAMVVVLQMGPVGESVPRLGPALPVALNVMIVLGTGYLLQGIAVSTHWLRRLPLGPFTAALAGAVQAMTVLGFPLLYLLVGLFDPWFDFRRLEHGREEQVPGDG
ncbi:YybS family protein [Myxococcota bacterium]|nr:YybS family protein [Myxococcota bacterium]